MPTRFVRFAAQGALALGLILLGTAPARAQTVIKLATLAPEGSSWMNLFHEWGRNVESHTGGKVKVKFYAGGVAGDERDAVRKMRLGQLNAAAVTAIGLGLIQSEVRVLELPMMIKNYAELDHVRTSMDADIRKKFEEKGYVLLSWGDVGPVHIFSNTPIKSKADLAQTKLWAWTDDPLVKTMFKQLGSNGVPLGVPDVLTSLQTGLINACYGSPLSMVALQWYTKVKYMTGMQLSQAI
ncbi:MAG TPA: TRAP transporter substrate-binding protein DctP, partial [Planctomycetota bacterium]|nr:TRAP transporter substrate-binding protein DctP [Planctomycetota bacterium]